MLDLRKTIVQDLSPYDLLKMAIIMQAVEDYQIALKINDTRMIHDVETFFRSEWYAGLCGIPGEKFIKHFRKEYENANHKTLPRNSKPHRWR